MDTPSLIGLGIMIGTFAAIGGAILGWPMALIIFILCFGTVAACGGFSK